MKTLQKRNNRKGDSMANTMQPLRDKEQIEQMKRWLLQNKSYKYYFFFTLGLNCGLRVSDLVQLRVKDVKDQTVLVTKVKKTGRELRIPLNPYIQFEIAKYVAGKSDNDCLFPSRWGVNKPITRQAASDVMKDLKKAFNLRDFNNHSLRKSFGYWYFKQNKDVYFLMKLFGHKTQEQTLDYIGILEDEIAKTMESFAV